MGFARLIAADLRSTAGRRWLMLVVLAGIIAIAVAATVASGRSDATRLDVFRTGTSGVIFLGGLVLAIGIGARALSNDGDSGFFGMLSVAGARREVLGFARAASRAILLLGALGVWLLASELASAAIGLGGDGPLAVHSVGNALNMLVVALVAVAASAVVSGGSAGTLALIVAVTTQAFTRLGNAADQGLVGNPTVGGAAKALRTALPRFIDSPMIANLQNRGKGGPVAPRFEVNGAIATAQSSSIPDILWTLLWCFTLAAMAANAMRRRSL